MKNPCHPQCEERSALCHAECPKYAAWREHRKEELANKRARNAETAFLREEYKTVKDYYRKGKRK